MYYVIDILNKTLVFKSPTKRMVERYMIDKISGTSREHADYKHMILSDSDLKKSFKLTKAGELDDLYDHSIKQKHKAKIAKLEQELKKAKENK